MKTGRPIGLTFGSFLVLLFAFSPAGAVAQEEPAAESSTGFDLVKEELANEQSEGLAPALAPPDLLGAEGQAALQGAYIAYYEYQQKGFTHRRNVFVWQLISSVVIFIVVITLMAAGIYFSWLQFKIGMAQDGAGKPQDTTTNLEVSESGIKISSPVLGVIILVISLAFFYLYLVHIYPIREIL